LVSNTSDDTQEEAPAIVEEVLVGPREAVSDDFAAPETEESKKWREELD